MFDDVTGFVVTYEDGRSYLVKIDTWTITPLDNAPPLAQEAHGMLWAQIGVYATEGDKALRKYQAKHF